MYKAVIIADSIAPSGKRLVTMEITFPRFILAEFNTHRALSRNSASSRAIPVEKRIEEVRKNPFIPEAFLQNKKGMQGGEPLDEEAAAEAREDWCDGARCACIVASRLAKLGVHKQYANRVLEPYLWHTAIVSATEWSNFFALRCHPDAQPEIQHIAYIMRDLYESHEPEDLPAGWWHLPYIQEDEHADYGDDPTFLCKLSVARCARVSYLTHDGKRSHIKDIELYDRLTAGSGTGHWSPFEHIACSSATPIQSGNFTGWEQLRKRMPNECQ